MQQDMQKSSSTLTELTSKLSESYMDKKQIQEALKDLKDFTRQEYMPLQRCTEWLENHEGRVNANETKVQEASKKFEYILNEFPQKMDDLQNQMRLKLDIS
jgi:chaperonin cofactor prefoldin